MPDKVFFVLQFGLFFLRFQYMRWFFVLALICFTVETWAQTLVNIRFEPKPSYAKKSFERVIIPSTQSLDSVIQLQIKKLNEHGYFMPMVHRDSLLADTVNLVINPGKLYSFYTVASFADNDLMLAERLFTGLKVGVYNQVKFSNAVSKTLNFYEQNGYPFATIITDSAIISGDSLKLFLTISKGKLFVFDTPGYSGTANVKTGFLQRFLSIKPGLPYNEQLLNQANARLSELPYLQTSGTPVVYFYGNKAKPYFFLNNRNANVFNAIIGLAPNSALNNKLVFTGEANLQLQNLLGTGKYFGFNFRSFLNGSQDLDLNFVWPYFMGSNIGLDYQFKLLRFDTLFVDLTNQIGVQYLLGGINHIKLFYEQQNVFTITTDTFLVRQSQQLPAYNDAISRLYGMSVKLSKLNYAPNPSKGFTLVSNAAVGTRSIVKNNLISTMRFNNNNQEFGLYDRLQLNTLQFKASVQASLFLNIYKNWVWHQQVNAALTQAPVLFINDMYRIGGLKTLRGFDEQAIFASTYAIYNTELRYLAATNTNMMLFYNIAKAENANIRKDNFITYHGLGAGLNLQAASGVFSIYYALGFLGGQTINFNQAKIHFGYINYF
jgi:hypothetical protein